MYPQSRTPDSSTKPLAFFFVLLASIYGLWLAALWPGLLGEDSLAVMLEVDRQVQWSSGKPAVWVYFVRAFYGTTGLVEIPIGAQLLVTAFVFARVLAWCRQAQLTKSFWFILIFVALAPQVVLYAGTLYPDGIFAVTSAGLMFELWLIKRENRLSAISIVMLLVTLPFAAFVRTNGILFLLLAFAIAFLMVGSIRKKVLVIVGAWTCIGFIITSSYDGQRHKVLFPLALFETVNFLQPRAMHLWTESPRVSPRSVEILTKTQPLEKVLAYYDRDYWDPLYYWPDGPAFGATLKKSEKKALVREFFTYNLWHNLPAFLGSRVNLFFASALAQGALPALDYTKVILSKTHSRSTFRLLKLNTLEHWLGKIHDFSARMRFVLWTPFVGMALLVMAWKRTEVRKDKVAALIVVVNVFHAGMIFLFSLAAEYRYLLPFVTLPIVMLPILGTTRQAAEQNA